jgi:DNA-binding CsgD family transcriptional regulator/PAS domain-containing protein
MVVSRENVGALIDKVYEAPLSPEGWASLLPSFEAAVGGRIGLFKKHTGHVDLLAGCSNTTTDQMSRYGADLWRQDRAVASLDSAPDGTIVVDSDLVERSQRSGTAFYDDFLQELDAERGIYASFLIANGCTYYVSARRSARQGDFGALHKYLLKDLSPHLRRSMRTWERLRRMQLEQSASATALDHARLGVLLVQRSGKLLHASTLAARLLQDGPFARNGDQLRGATHEVDTALRKAIEWATRPGKPVSDSFVLGGGTGSAPMSVLAQPYPGSRGRTEEPVAMLLLSPNQPPPTISEAVAKAYKLTRAEMRLLQALIDGERLTDYARRCGISAMTAKTHLRALFDKTGERRQADLIRRVLTDTLLQS